MLALRPQLQQLPLQHQHQYLAAAQAQFTRMTQESMMQGYGIPQGFMHGGGPAMSGAQRVLIPAQSLQPNLHPMLAPAGPVGFVNGTAGYLRAHAPFVGAPGGGPAGAVMPQAAGAAPGGGSVATSAPDGAAAGGGGITVPLLAVSQGQAGQVGMHAGRGSMPMGNMLGVAAGGLGGPQFVSGGAGGFCMPVGAAGGAGGAVAGPQGPVGLPPAMLQGGGFVMPAQGIHGMGGVRMSWPQGRLVCVDNRMNHAPQTLQNGISRGQ